MLASKLIIHLIVGAGALLMLLPLYWMVVSAFKPLPEIMTVPVTFIPVNATLENFKGLLTETFFARSMLNSTAIALA
jgi:multiple sugar transport system permease protein